MADDDPKLLPAPPPDDDNPVGESSQDVVPGPTLPPLSQPASSGFFTRFRINQDTRTLRGLSARQHALRELIEAYGASAAAAIATAETVALLQDLPEIRAEARARAADERDAAAHRREVARSKRAEELYQQQHRTNVARFGERVFRETEPVREQIRKHSLRTHEHEVATAVADAEARAMSAAAGKNNAEAVRHLSDRDLAGLKTSNTAAAASSATRPSFSIETVLVTLDAEVRTARARGDQAGVDALNNLAARLIAHDSYAPGTTLNLEQVRAVIADEIDKATARNAYAAVAALYRLRDALDAATHGDGPP